MMKWNKYPATTPRRCFPDIDISDKCLIWISVPDPLGMNQDGHIIEIAHLNKDEWVTDDWIFASVPKDKCKVKYWMLLSDLPNPSEKISSSTEEYLK